MTHFSRLKSLCVAMLMATAATAHAEPPRAELYAEAAHRAADGYGAASLWLRLAVLAAPVTPFVGVGAELVSQPGRPATLRRPASYEYLTLGVMARGGGLALRFETRLLRYLEPIDALSSYQPPLDSRATLTYGELWHGRAMFAATGQWFAEPYGELVLYRRGDVQDGVGDGFLRGGYRALALGSKSFVDAILEPYAALSGRHERLGDRAELRVGPRLAFDLGGPWLARGAAWLTGALYMQQVWGAFLRGVPEAAASEHLRYAARGYATQRYLLAIGGGW